MGKKTELRLRIYGNPVAQGRPRAFRRGNFIGMYDPQKSKSWKDTVAAQAIEQILSISPRPQPFQNAIRMNVKFILERPKSLSKKVIYHTKKPDLSNLVKGIEDALKGICYRDDSQIVEQYLEKMYVNGHSAEEHIHAGVIIEIEEL